MTLFVVRDARKDVRFVCRICRTRFYDGEERAYERHVVACASWNEEELRAKSARTINPHLFDPQQSGDVEFGEWIHANREALIEGRKKLK